MFFVRLIKIYESQTSFLLFIQTNYDRCIIWMAEIGKKEIWEEKFRFNVKYEGDQKDHTNTKLILRIMDKHRLSSDKLVGETTYVLIYIHLTNLRPLFHIFCFSFLCILFIYIHACLIYNRLCTWIL